MSIVVSLDNPIWASTIPFAGQTEFHEIWVPIGKKYNLKFITDVVDRLWYQFDYQGFLELIEDLIKFKTQLEHKEITSADDQTDDWLIMRLGEIISALEEERGNEKITGNIG